MEFELAIERVSLASLQLAAGVLFYVVLLPPNPPVKGTLVEVDTLIKHMDSVIWARPLLLFLTVAHTLIILFPANSITAPAFASGHLSPVFFTWNTTSAAVLSTILATSFIRFQAMRTLKDDFTFELRTPRKLNTSGMYRYVQHPAYSFGIIAVLAMVGWHFRCDAALGLVMPEAVLRTQLVWNTVMFVAWVLIMFVGVGIRIVQEEEVLQKGFGKEWELWHKRTPRFFPFLF